MGDDRSVLGLSPRMASALAYAGMFVTGILILVFERDNKQVRFHAMQSTVAFLPLLFASALITHVFGWIFIIGGIVNLVVSSVSIGLWIFLIYKAAIGEEYRLPIVGDAAWKQVNK